MPAGAEVVPDGVQFRVWAPEHKQIEVVIGNGEHIEKLNREADGYFCGIVARAKPGTRYRYRIDGGDAYPDPCSRFQPDGPHKPSEVIDPGEFRWTDGKW